LCIIVHLIDNVLIAIETAPLIYDLYDKYWWWSDINASCWSQCQNYGWNSTNSSDNTQTENNQTQKGRKRWKHVSPNL
jgi:hypothetical protein